MGFVDTARLRRFAPEKLQKLNIFETDQMFADVYCLAPGQAQPPHRHPDATKFYFVIEGRATVRIGESVQDLESGQIAHAEPGIEHGVENRSDRDAVLLVAMAPNPNRLSGVPSRGAEGAVHPSSPPIPGRPPQDRDPGGRSQ